MSKSIIGAVLAILLCSLAAVQAQPVYRASQSSDGDPGISYSQLPSISGDGRYVAFRSLAWNLVPGDTNDNWDIFVHDRVTRETVLVSKSSTGEQANGESSNPVMSADGRFVAFDSWATNLIANDWNFVRDIFLHDRDPDQNGIFDEPGTTTVRITRSGGFTETNKDSWEPCLSADGRYVGFLSIANNIVLGDTEGQVDAFWVDTALDEVKRLSVAADGTGGNSRVNGIAISDDGQVVAFSTPSNNLVPGDNNAFQDVFVSDVATGQLTLVSRDHLGNPGSRAEAHVAISGDGRYVGFETATALQVDDTNGVGDVFVYDRVQDTSRRVSIFADGSESVQESQLCTLSIDGRYVGLRSLEDFDPIGVGFQNNIFRHDRDVDGNGVFDEPGGIETRVMSMTWDSQYGHPHCNNGVLSRDGRFAAFTSVGFNLLPDDDFTIDDTYLRDAIRLELDGTPAAGNPVHFEVSGATGEAGNLALVLLSCTGIDAFALPNGGETLYLTPDSCTSLALSAGFLFQGVVDAGGLANTPTVAFPSITPGLTIHAAAITINAPDFESLTSPITFQSQ
ncbi:MAG: hypothetical protein RL885_09890 [Planctomycetota bacterium]